MLVHGGTIADWALPARPRGRIARIAARVGTSVPSPTAHLVGADSHIQMKLPSATIAALTTAVLAVVVALPAAASTTGTSNGGASASEPTPSAQQADYKAVKASWYGPGLYGNHLACGGRLRHATLGVAHRRLPCGTKVSIRYHGRSIVVPVIDRGPYSRGISYDLTQATARKLGMTQTSRVRAAALGR